MLEPIHTDKFRKDYALAARRGWDIAKLDEVMILITAEQPSDFKTVIFSLTDIGPVYSAGRKVGCQSNSVPGTFAFTHTLASP
ncbi:hypothetical protein FACS189483_02990 [Spirochaetia bacterium]|nr:hypothetical protein FACS189483_02990 [Spirochaetia bacterium]